MKIYIDFDDVISETARGLAVMLKRFSGKTVIYEDIDEFDLRKSFSLSQNDYNRFMEIAHSPEELISLDETPGACSCISKWKSEGLSPVIVTGRPAWSNDISRTWLDKRGLSAVPMIYVDKYSREIGPEYKEVTTYKFDDLADMGFDLAIDDAPPALDLLDRSGLCPYVIFDRPWNKNYTSSSGIRVNRVSTWTELDEFVSERLSVE